MAQPNFQNLCDALVTVGQEVALMPNVPVVDVGGQLLQIQQTLQQMQQQIQQTQQQIQQTQQQIQQVQQTQQQMQQQNQQTQQQIQQVQETQQQIQQVMQQQGQQMSRSDRNNFARMLNSSAHRDTRLEVLYDANDQPVQNFPATGADISALTGREINVLLEQLGLPADGTVADRKHRFFEYIGYKALA